MSGGCNANALAIVTGASSGIGRAFAVELDRHGYEVVLVGRHEAALAAVAETLGHPPLLLVSDLAEEAGVEVVAAAIARLRPGVLVNAAGLTTATPFPWSDDRDERRQVQVNVVAVLRLSQVAAKAMAEVGCGAIINVGSTAAWWSVGTYAASKAWVVPFSAGLGRAGRERGVRAIAVCPGFTRTDLHARAGVDASGVPAWLWTSPEHVAQDGLKALADGRVVRITGRLARLQPVAIRGDQG